MPLEIITTIEAINAIFTFIRNLESFSGAGLNINAGANKIYRDNLKSNSANQNDFIPFNSQKTEKRKDKAAIVVSQHVPGIVSQNVEIEESISIKSIRKKISEGLIIEHISFGLNKWHVIFSRNQLIRKQSVKKFSIFPRRFIGKNIWAKGQRVHSIAHGKLGHWIIAYGDQSDYLEQGWVITSTNKLDSRLEFISSKKLAIDEIIFTGKNWIIFYSKQRIPADQAILIDPMLSRGRIKDHLDKGYKIRAFEHGMGRWVFILCKNLSRGKQKLIVENEVSKSLIRDQINEKFCVESITFGK